MVIVDFPEMRLEKGKRIRRLHRLHFSSIPLSLNRATSCPQWHRASGEYDLATGSVILFGLLDSIDDFWFFMILNFIFVIVENENYY